MSYPKPLAPLASLPAISFSDKELVIIRLRHPRAQAYALDAIVQLAISEGELTPDQLENLSLLTRRLFDDLEALSAFVDDLGITTGEGSSEGTRNDD